MFPAVDKNESFPERELAIGEFWKARGIYEKTLAARADAPPFVFYEGPPTANGLPHPGHCLTRAIKDLFPRYRTMRGYRCERKAGWDTHGLPVEVEVCKELGIHSKEEIEEYGIEPFIQKCQQSVWRYMQEWERLTERLGFWVNLEEAYVTYRQSYVESVWWSLKTLFDRGLLYQGHKIVWWWAQGGTALSSGEVGQGYREVADPSVFVKFPLTINRKAKELGLSEGTSLLVWTTTPWTLPSNHFVAVNLSLDYDVISDAESGELLVVASALVDTIAAKTKCNLGFVKRLRGRELLGLRYQPPFGVYHAKLSAQQEPLYRPGKDESWADYPYIYAHNKATSLAKNTELYGDDANQAALQWLEDNPTRHVGWHIVPASFVTTDSGTGLVHIAPAFGEDDYELLLSEKRLMGPSGKNPPLLNCVAPDGKFTDEAPEFCRGRWVKDCDKDIVRDLKQRGLLFHQEQYRHDYPFCWRAEEDPLIQYPRESWFIRTSDHKDDMLANNAKINWLPEHIKDGRFGKFLETNVDWALSRERYWGTPLPIWVCERTGQMEAVGSYDELRAKPQAAGFEVWQEAKAANPELPDDLRVHKPYIDAVTYASPFAEGARMRRVTEVIDCWYDSGAMPFAQWGFRGEDASVARERFESQFPADFISEALDQTRGWFYSQLAISTLLFGEGAGDRRQETGDSIPKSPYPHPFRNCIVLGLMLGEDGQKMSKSKRNYRDPSEIFDLYGADALRWFFFARQPPWTTIRYSEQSIKDSIPEFLLRLWNVYSFFNIYANIDEFDPAEELPGSAWSLKRPGHKRPGQLDESDMSHAESYRPVAERSELDRWIISELNSTAASVVERMDEYDNYSACQAVIAFVDALSNWYVRRSRDRFWASEKRSPDKLDAYWTLYECLLTTAKLIAPFVPYLAESLWQHLAVSPFRQRDGGERVPESVHLCDYPVGDQQRTDETLSARMNLVRQISSLGRQARSNAELKVRQPLAKVEVILADTTHQPWLEEHAAVIADELNVKAVEFSDEPERFVEHEVLPNFKLLGPKLGKLVPKVKKALNEQSGSKLLANIRDNGKVNLQVEGQSVELTADEIEVRIKAREGWTAANAMGVVVVLDTTIDKKLEYEGIARTVARIANEVRKFDGLKHEERVQTVHFVCDNEMYREAAVEHSNYICAEALAEQLCVGDFTTYESRISATEVEASKSGNTMDLSYNIEGEKVAVLLNR